MAPNRWTAVLVLAILAAGAGGTWWTVRRADGEMRADLLAQSRRVAQGLNLIRVAALGGTDCDEGSPTYQRLRAGLVLVGQASDQVQSLYLLGRRQDATVFVIADSAPSDSGRARRPEPSYAGPTATVLRVFATDQAVVDGPAADRGGVWMRAYVPVSDPWSDAVLAVFGMDVDARAWNRELARAALLPVLLTLLLASASLAAAALLARRRRAADWPPWLRHVETGWVVAAGLLLTIFAARTACTHETHGRGSTFAQLADSETERVAKVLRDLNEFELKGLAKFCEHAETVTAEEFRSYAEPLTANPAVQAWEWVPVVAGPERASFERAAVASGLAGFECWERDSSGRRVPAARREVYYPVLHVVPQAANEAAVGYEVGSEPVRRTTLDSAARTALGTATAPITLVQETGNQKGMVIFRAAYTPGTATVRGFAVAVLRMGTLLENVQESSAVHLELALLDGAAPPEPLASRCGASCPESSGIAVSRPVAVFGQVCLVTAHPGPDFLSRSPLRAGGLTALTGTLVTALLAGMIGVSLRRREELEELVARRTSEYQTLFREMLDACALHEIICDAQGRPVDYRFLAVNPAFERQTGLQAETVVGKTVLEVLPDTEPHWIETYGQVALTGRPVEFESYSIPLQKTFAVAAFRTGPNQFACSFADITERKRAAAERERMLAAAEASRRTLLNLVDDLTRSEAERARLAAAIEQAGEAVVVTDPAGAIQYVNPQFETVTGYTRAEALGSNPRILKSGRQDEAFYRELWATITSGRTWLGRLVNQRKDGTLYTEDAIISPVRDATGGIVNFVAVKRDVTEHLRACEENAQLEQQLQQAQKVESIGRLAGGIAHDFNNNLSVILGYGELILDRLPPHDPVREELHQIMEAGRRSAALTRQLLAFSRRQTLRPEVLDLNAVVRGLEPMLRRLIGENIHLDLALAPDLGRVLADPGQLEQVLINLAVNARDAMPQGGKLTFATANTELGETAARACPRARPGAYARLSVTDTGCGMDAPTLARIFEPFFTTKDRGKGTGLGLPTVLGIIEQSGGHLSVDSTPGTGTTFCVNLPLTLAEPTGSQNAPSGTRPPGGGERILIVEDEASLRSLVEREVAALGYEVRVAADGEEALRLVEQQRFQPDLLLTDVVMPGISGSVLADRLRRVDPGLKVLYMSGYTDDAIVRHGVLAPNTHLISKPFRTAELAAKLREVLEQP